MSYLFIYSLSKDKHIAEDLTSGGVDVEKGYPDHAVLWAEVKQYIPNRTGGTIMKFSKEELEKEISLLSSTIINCEKIRS